MAMRFRELKEKELIDFDRGERLGVLGDADLILDPSGRIEAIVLAAPSLFGFPRRRAAVVIPWDAVLSVGPDLIIVRSSQAETGGLHTSAE
jgi:sporulation protein, YlmC/YmxH family|nr:YlmC/YmxH family sporulation protein [Bacillota bacterium]